MNLMRTCTVSALRAVIITLVVAFLSACASFGPTKPNQVFKGLYPPIYYELAEYNSLLAQELGKLPEFQDGISPSEATALEQIGVLYKRDPDVFADAFRNMYQVGKPEVRRYCSPLQALFWLAEDGKLSIENAFLASFSLVKSLRKAWFSERSPLSNEQMVKIINGLKLKEDRMEYSKLLQRVGDSKFWEYIFIDYNKKPEMFTDQARKTMKDALNKNISWRWKGFDVVTTRLNAPKLIDYYTKNNFHYKAYTSDFGSARLAFRRKGGNCVEIEAFQRYCLKRAGYKAFRLRADSRGKSSWATWHAVTRFYDKGKMYIVDNGTTRPRGILGPFTSIMESGYAPYIGP